MKTFLVIAALSLALCGCQSGPDVNALQNQISSLRQQLATAQEENSKCSAKFERSTILYDVGLFNSEQRAWVIPADVDPVLVGPKAGTYSHYDPKTQTETIHFKSKPQ